VVVQKRINLMCDHLEYVIENGNKWCVDCGTALGQPFELEKE